MNQNYDLSCSLSLSLSLSLVLSHTHTYIHTHNQTPVRTAQCSCDCQGVLTVASRPGRVVLIAKSQPQKKNFCLLLEVAAGVAMDTG